MLSTVHVVFVIGCELHLNVGVVIKAVDLNGLHVSSHAIPQLVILRILQGLLQRCEPLPARTDVDVVMVFPSFLFYLFHGRSSIGRQGFIMRLRLYEPAHW